MKKIIIALLLFLTIYINAQKSRKEIVAELFRSVEDWMGTTYIYGGDTQKGVDCSGFVQNVYMEVFNKNIPRTVRDQQNLGSLVKGNLQPGDLLFFKINGKISHVGIYVFDNKFIHAAYGNGGRKGVIKSSLNEKYYKQRFSFAKRVINLPPFKKTPVKKASIKKDIVNKEIETKNASIQNDKKGYEIITGKVLFRGDILEEDTTFNENIPIFIRVNSAENERLRIKIINNTQKSIALLKLNNNNNLKRISLTEGEYQLQLILKNSVISKKNIFVN